MADTLPLWAGSPQWMFTHLLKGQHAVVRAHGHAGGMHTAYLILGIESIEFDAPLPGSYALWQQLPCSGGCCLFRAIFRDALTQGMHVMLGLLRFSCFCLPVRHRCIMCLRGSAFWCCVHDVLRPVRLHLVQNQDLSVKSCTGVAV